MDVDSFWNYSMVRTGLLNALYEINEVESFLKKVSYLSLFRLVKILWLICDGLLMLSFFGKTIGWRVASDGSFRSFFSCSSNSARGFITPSPVPDCQFVEGSEITARAWKRRAVTVVVGRPPLVLVLSRCFLNPACSFLPYEVTAWNRIITRAKMYFFA